MCGTEITKDGLQVLRAIDKVDKIGPNGVVELVRKRPEEFGAGLDRASAELVGQYLGTKGKTDEETIDNLKSFQKKAGLIRSRLDMMVFLENMIVGEGETAWDRLLGMTPNEDQSWKDGGRPANIGWALDDILNVAKKE